MQKVFLFSFLLGISGVASVHAAETNKSNPCEVALEGRPTSSKYNIILKPGAWIPRAPEGKIYLATGSIVGSAIYGYQLADDTVQQHPGEQLEPLPAGYAYILVNQLEIYPPINVYRIALIHPFPRASFEGKALSAEENKLFYSGLADVAAKVKTILMSRALPELMRKMLANALGNSLLVTDQMGSQLDRLVSNLMNVRMKIRNSENLVQTEILKSMPVARWLMRHPRIETDAPRSRLGEKITVSNSKDLPELPADEEWLLRGSFETLPPKYQYECVKKR